MESSTGSTGVRKQNHEPGTCEDSLPNGRVRRRHPKGVGPDPGGSREPFTSKGFLGGPHTQETETLPPGSTVETRTATTVSSPEGWFRGSARGILKPPPSQGRRTGKTLVYQDRLLRLRETPGVLSPVPTCKRSREGPIEGLVAFLLPHPPRSGLRRELLTDVGTGSLS